MSLATLVLEYKNQRKAGQVPPFSGPIEKAIEQACRETKNKKAELLATRMKREIDQVTFNDWDDMHDWIAGLCPEGIGEVSVFKIATFLGPILGLGRTSLYLRGDVRTCWNKLHGTRRVPEIEGRVPQAMLPPDLRGMLAPDIEAMLTFNLDRLEPWLKARPEPDWIAEARKSMSPTDQRRLDEALKIVGERPVTRGEARLLAVTDRLVDDFAEALKTKLLAAQLRYGYEDGWSNNDWRSDCIKHLKEHVKKGDPRDVAAYCAFAWYHGWSTS